MKRKKGEEQREGGEQERKGDKTGRKTNEDKKVVCGQPLASIRTSFLSGDDGSPGEGEGHMLPAQVVTRIT